MWAANSPDLALLALFCQMTNKMDEFEMVLMWNYENVYKKKKCVTALWCSQDPWLFLSLA